MPEDEQRNYIRELRALGYNNQTLTGLLARSLPTIYRQEGAPESIGKVEQMGYVSLIEKIKAGESV
ncbi:MAG: hypothetical protein CMI54_02050 [Parcubacteria group bacterium]|jgi:hypothetical protein|nr:hypothetical protein [Parcubacteria group bacterium]|tara:strand:- start:2373 stop:2570 length:198 start_codon:yes stop_codon:yes gene_type:complete